MVLLRYAATENWKNLDGYSQKLKSEITSMNDRGVDTDV